uniref:Pre-mRNA-splicing factor SYF2 n=1 Tax=Caenorhabditis tropicalis TaxID=1561998 RepID=A0A1I7U515_9PELO
MVHAPKILKKKKTTGNTNNNNNMKVLNDANPKRVHFDIEQFLSREASKGDRVEARERMLASLGAAPAKRDYLNYKDLKVERALKKAEAKAHAEMNHANSLSLLNIKKKNKQKK